MGGKSGQGERERERERESVEGGEWDGEGVER